MSATPSGRESNAASLLLTATITGFAALLVYAFTASTGPGLHDSAELALRAAQLGATHATGAPLHTVIGHLLSYVFSSPAAATTWLSVGCAALTAGLVVLLIGSWVEQPWLAAAGGLAFAVLPPIWVNAVITELYAPSLLLLAGALFAIRRWEVAGHAKLPVAVVVLLALALGAHFANVLLLPVFVLLVLAVSRSMVTALLFATLLAVAVGAVAAANVGLALRLPPLSEYQPLTPEGLWLYMTGAEHQARAVTGAGFYLGRLVEHLALLAGNFVFVGLAFIALGVRRVFLSTPRYAWFLLGITFVWFAYFTFFGSGDYFVMIGPVYLLCSVWLALGVADLAERWSPALPEVTPVAVLSTFAVAALVLQWPERRMMAVATSIETYVDAAFAAWPEDAVAVARWNEFTALRYAQYVQGRRGDVRLLVPARTQRHYEHGVVPDYFTYITMAVCERPVVTNKLTPEIEAQFAVAEIPGTGSWLQLQRPDTCEQGL